MCMCDRRPLCSKGRKEASRKGGREKERENGINGDPFNIGQKTKWGYLGERIRKGSTPRTVRPDLM